MRSVDGYGPGLVACTRKPGGRGLAVVTTYGMDHQAFAALEQRRRAGYAD